MAICPAMWPLTMAVEHYPPPGESSYLLDKLCTCHSCTSPVTHRTPHWATSVTEKQAETSHFTVTVHIMNNMSCQHSTLLIYSCLLHTQGLNRQNQMCSCLNMKVSILLGFDWVDGPFLHLKEGFRISFDYLISSFAVICISVCIKVTAKFILKSEEIYLRNRSVNECRTVNWVCIKPFSE